MVFVPGGQVSTAYLPAWTCLLYFSFTLIVGSLPVLMLTMVCTVSKRKPDRVGDMAVVGWAAGL